MSPNLANFPSLTSGKRRVASTESASVRERRFGRKRGKENAPRFVRSADGKSRKWRVNEKKRSGKLEEFPFFCRVSRRREEARVGSVGKETRVESGIWTLDYRESFRVVWDSTRSGKVGTRRRSVHCRDDIGSFRNTAFSLDIRPVVGVK